MSSPLFEKIKKQRKTSIFDNTPLEALWKECSKAADEIMSIKNPACPVFVFANIQRIVKETRGDEMVEAFTNAGFEIYGEGEEIHNIRYAAQGSRFDLNTSGVTCTFYNAVNSDVVIDIHNLNQTMIDLAPRLIEWFKPVVYGQEKLTVNFEINAKLKTGDNIADTKLYLMMEFTEARSGNVFISRFTRS
ncbi:hypothetical protein TOTORO_01550 [Serratia phage vB_SmaS-Totoro]|nr:hypothetical protein TOTORO_01550 [Serratia phage vB_SmaS-Totoro]